MMACKYMYGVLVVTLPRDALCVMATGIIFSNRHLSTKLPSYNIWRVEIVCVTLVACFMFIEILYARNRAPFRAFWYTRPTIASQSQNFAMLKIVCDFFNLRLRCLKIKFSRKSAREGPLKCAKCQGDIL